MLWNNRIGSIVVREYELDLKCGVPLSIVASHAERKIKQLKARGDWAGTTAAKQLEDWLNKQNNP